MLNNMIIQLNKYPHSIEWGYTVIRWFYEMAKDEQIVKFWPPSEWKEWRTILIYLTRHLPPKQGVALGA
jgi:hypothetical protein